MNVADSERRDSSVLGKERMDLDREGHGPIPVRDQAPINYARKNGGDTSRLMGHRYVAHYWNNRG